jgi:hypothetical protein
MASFHPSATIARIDGRWPSLLPSCSKTGGKNERLGAGAYRGSRCRLRHSISVAGPKIPSTKAVKGRSLSPADKRHHFGLADIQAIFCRRRHQHGSYGVPSSISGRSAFIGQAGGKELKAASLIAKWRVPKAMIGRRLAEAKKLLAKFE